MFCTYYTYRNLPVAFATSIGMSGALFTTILSRIILKDHVTALKWLLIIIGYLGVIVLVNPTSYVIDIAIITSLVANLIASIGYYYC
jgi:drug/metabolite transporter (DMT)-like permease